MNRRRGDADVSRSRRGRTAAEQRIGAQANPTKRWTLIGAEGSVGQQIDFANARCGSGPAFHFDGSLQPLDRLELTVDGNLQWIDRARAGRAFTAQTERLRIAWAFNVRSAIRVIVQNDHTHRLASLSETAVASRSGSLVTSVSFISFGSHTRPACSSALVTVA